MNRRAFVTGLGAVLAAPLAAEAQKPSKPPRIGTLSAFSPPSQPDWQQRSPFWGAMRELGWIEGQNIMVERRWAEGRLDRLPALATELVQLKVDLSFLKSRPSRFAGVCRTDLAI
jgi:putative tryptophan/tyrosine transport system substrate-binding protein